MTLSQQRSIHSEGCYDGHEAASLAAAFGLPRVVAFDEVGSTLDVAHRLAAERTPSGTLVLADAQTAGRGRMGRSWRSAPAQGVWLTLVERPPAGEALDVLSLRIGIAAAAALDVFTDAPVRLKWPNDLHVDEGKLAGILIEARWREASLDWVAIGFGLNVRRPTDVAGAAGLRAGVQRLDALRALVPAIRGAAARQGALDATEREAFAARDLARGRECIEPARGIVAGIDARGALLVATHDGTAAFRVGSLVLREPAATSNREQRERT